MNNNIYAAIAMALYEYAGNNVHDVESALSQLNQSRHCGMRSSKL